MQIEAWELFTVPLVLREPFVAAHSSVTVREVLLVRVLADGVEGWSECGVLPEAGYGHDSVASAAELLRTVALPTLATSGSVESHRVVHLLARLAGHREVVAAAEAAVLDAECRRDGVSMAARLSELSGWASCTGIPAGVALGIAAEPREVAASAATFVEAGYARVKVKIAPGADWEVLRAVRNATDVELCADANGAYAADDLDSLVSFEEFGLGFLEQPFGRSDLATHAALARRTVTPVCLDESVVSAAGLDEAADAGACSVLNLKWSRVGGLHEALRILERCRARGVDAWVGGMLSSGVGRAADVALASLSTVTMTGDISESRRYFDSDLTEPFVLSGGSIAVPDGPGLGVAVDTERIRSQASAHWSHAD